MARLKTGGRPLLVLFRRGFVIVLWKIVVITLYSIPPVVPRIESCKRRSPPEGLSLRHHYPQWSARPVIGCHMRSDQIFQLIGVAFGAVALLSLAYLAYMLLS